MNVPLAVISPILAAALALLGYLGKRTIAAFDAITLTQREIASSLIQEHAVAAGRHDDVMDALRSILEHLGLAKRVEALETLVKGQGSAPAAGPRSSASRASRPGR